MMFGIRDDDGLIVPAAGVALAICEGSTSDLKMDIERPCIGYLRLHHFLWVIAGPPDPAIGQACLSTGA